MYKPVNMKDVTYERLSEICDRTQHSKMALLEMLINELYILIKPIDQANIEFTGSHADGILKILVRDRDRFIVGQFEQPMETSDKETDLKIKALVEAELEQKKKVKKQNE